MTTRKRTSRGGTFPERTGSPPPPEFFEGDRPPLGVGSVRIQVEEIRIVLSGLDAAIEEEIRSRYGAFATDAPAREGDVEVRVGREERPFFLEPAARAEFNPVFLAADGDRVRFMSLGAAARFDAGGGPGVFLLATGTAEPAGRSVENFLRVAAAWRAAKLGGALVHAAAIAVRDRGYLFYGPSGAGKSTIASVNRRGTVFGDDLSLVLAGVDGTPRIVASPWAGDRAGGLPPGRSAPLAAGFRLVHADETAVVPVARVVGFSELVASLPFLADLFAVRPDLLARIGETFRDVPLARLHFRMDDGFWDAISRAGL